MKNELYDFSPIGSRPSWELPNGARVAFYVLLAVEYYMVDRPGMSIAPHAAGFVPDPLNYGWRDYGPRVASWRMADMFERYSIPVTAGLNSDACAAYPEIIEDGKKRNWAWVAHGTSNNVIHQNMTEDEERAHLREMHRVIREATGTEPRGWIGPVLTETFNTPKLLQELGYTYVLDWGGADDQPFPLNVDPGPMINIPYALEVNDATVYVGRNLPGPEYERMLIDHFDQLYHEGADGGRVMGVGLHAWIVGQPSRFKYFENAMAYIAGHKGAWLTTSDGIAESYLEQFPS